MNAPETPLQQAERHVRQAEAFVSRQERIIAEMDRDGHPEAAARGRAVLETLQRSLELAREHRLRLLASRFGC
jgi:hypothetical protein